VKLWTREAQRLRDQLGQHQDLLMLASMTGPHQPLVRWRSRLEAAIAERKAAHVAAAPRPAARPVVPEARAPRRRPPARGAAARGDVGDRTIGPRRAPTPRRSPAAGGR